MSLPVLFTNEISSPSDEPVGVCPSTVRAPPNAANSGSHGKPNHVPLTHAKSKANKGTAPCSYSNGGRTDALNPDQDLVAFYFDLIDVGGGDDGHAGWFAGRDLECAAVQGAFEFVADDFAVTQGCVLMGAAIAEGIEVAIEVDQADRFVIRPDLDVVQFIRGQISVVLATGYQVRVGVDMGSDQTPFCFVIDGRNSSPWRGSVSARSAPASRI